MQRVMNAPMMGLNGRIKEREEGLKRSHSNLYKYMADLYNHRHVTQYSSPLDSI